MSETAVAVREESVPMQALSAAQVVHHVAQIQEIMAKVMHKGEHYDTIPGTDKPSLLKAGAEKLGFTFRLIPRFDVKRTDLPGGHREYEILCTLVALGSGETVGQGVGTCSTMESKFRYRNVADYEITDTPIPADAKERKGEYRKAGYGMKKVDGAWYWVKYGDSSRQENPDIADTYNTVLKMAKKRAHVDAVITATAASDIFTQDVEETVDSVPKASNHNGNGVNAEISALLAELAYDEDAKAALRKRAKEGQSLESIRDELRAKAEARQLEVDAAADAGFDGDPAA